MKRPEQLLMPDRSDFERDPIGYSSLAWHKWGIAQNLAGVEVDIEKPPTSEDLKSPALWLTQAQAMAEAAKIIINNEPPFEHIHPAIRGVCDSQYSAVGLMLVGYSLEICLKAMIIIKKGILEYTAEEKYYKHHRLVELADFIPDLSEKDNAILECLTHFTYWAGRYPDPGSGRIGNAIEIFSISEKYQISAKDIFDTTMRISKKVNFIISEK